MFLQSIQSIIYWIISKRFIDAIIIFFILVSVAVVVFENYCNHTETNPIERANQIKSNRITSHLHAKFVTIDIYSARNVLANQIMRTLYRSKWLHISYCMHCCFFHSMHQRSLTDSWWRIRWISATDLLYNLVHNLARAFIIESRQSY